MRLTVKQTAEKFGVTTTSVYNWIKAGLPCKTEKVIGRKPRMVIDPNDVYDFLGVKRDITQELIDGILGR